MFLKNSVLAIAVVLMIAGLVQAQAPAALAGIAINFGLGAFARFVIRRRGTV